MNYTFKLSFFGIALGFILAIQMFGPVLPVRIGVSVLMGFFWPYLTRGQNLSIGGVRLLTYLPRFYRRVFRAQTEVGVVIDFYSWLHSLVDFAPSNAESILVYSNFMRYAWVGIEVFIPLLGFFVAPYVFYRFYRWKGVFERIRGVVWFESE